jgi:hypothetical protein
MGARSLPLWLMLAVSGAACGDTSSALPPVAAPGEDAGDDGPSRPRPPVNGDDDAVTDGIPDLDGQGGMDTGPDAEGPDDGGTPDVEDGGEAPDTGDPADVALPPADVEAPPPVVCPPVADAWTGVFLEDLNGGALAVGDVVRLQIDVVAPTPAADPIRLEVDHTNLRTRVESATRDGVPFTPGVVGERWTVVLERTGPMRLIWEAEVVADTDLVAVTALLRQAEVGCEVPRSRAGAFFQIAGGESKTPVCIDMEQFRSMQVAPAIPPQNTAAWSSRNGARTDLRVDEFIFCPQAPSIVHQATFCLQRAPGQTVALAGSWRADATWEVDDFVLIEVDDGAEVRDGFTTQFHTGHPNRFYCDALDRHMCTGDRCTAALIEEATGRSIPAIASVTAEGADARRHQDGAVRINDLLPASGTPADVTVTALDVGVEGTLRPALYLVSEPPSP